MTNTILSLWYALKFHNRRWETVYPCPINGDGKDAMNEYYDEPLVRSEYFFLKTTRGSPAMRVTTLLEPYISINVKFVPIFCAINVRKTIWYTTVLEFFLLWLGKGPLYQRTKVSGALGPFP